MVDKIILELPADTIGGDILVSTETRERAEAAAAQAEATVSGMIVDGTVTGDDLVLTKAGGGTVVAGNVRGEQGTPGLPGVNAVENDEAVATYIQTAGTLSRDALDTAFIGSRTTVEQEVAPVGPELLVGGAWTLGAGWSGNVTDGFTHVAGQNEPLTWVPPFSTGNDLFIIEWQYDGNPDHQDKWSGFDLSFGGGDAGIIYQGTATANQYSRGIRSLADGPLVVAPWATGEFEGRLHSFSIRRVTGPVETSPATFHNAAGATAAALRFGSDGSSVYLGDSAGQSGVSDKLNVGIGSSALRDNVTGFFNVAVGDSTLAGNVSGTRNAGIGYAALAANASGDRNVGIGPFALTRNTIGQRNIAIGVDVLWRNEDGNDNIGIGYLALTEMGSKTGTLPSTGRDAVGNIAIGRYAMRNGKYGLNNIAIGEEALLSTRGNDGIAIGARAARNHNNNGVVAIGVDALSILNPTTQDGQIAIGARALSKGRSATQFIQNTAVGYEAGMNLMRGHNTAVGHEALKGDPLVESTGTDGSKNTAIGARAGYSVTTGWKNTFIGDLAGSNTTTGSRNILIGQDTYAGIGSGAGTRSDRLNIGNFIRGDLAAGALSIGIPFPGGSASSGITARLDIAEGTTDYPSLRLRAGVLSTTPVAGALEFDGTNLYITIGSTRREIALV